MLFTLVHKKQAPYEYSDISSRGVSQRVLSDGWEENPAMSCLTTGAAYK